MRLAVYLPLLLPALFAAPLARATRRPGLEPRRATWVLTGVALVLGRVQQRSR